MVKSSVSFKCVLKIPKQAGEMTDRISSQHPIRSLTITSNSISRGSDGLFWALWSLAQTWQPDKQISRCVCVRVYARTMNTRKGFLLNSQLEANVL